MGADFGFVIIMLATANREGVLTLRVLAWDLRLVLRQCDLGQPGGVGLAV